MSPLLDIVIPTAARNDRVAGLLDDLRRELLPFAAHVGRVVVVDDCTVADVLPQLIGASSEARIAARPSTLNGPGVNRNRGAEGSRADWVVFLDDDVRLAPGWGHETIAVLTQAGMTDLVGAAIGSQHPRNWFSQASEDFVVRHRRYPEGWYLAAAHLMVRRRAFEELGGFDTTFAYGGEDWDFCRRAHVQELSVCVVERPAVVHANPTSWRALRRKAVQYGRANAVLDEEASPVAPGGSLPGPAAADGSDVSSLPGPLRGLPWAFEEFTLLRDTGRGRWRSLRSVALYIPWMVVYLRTQSASRKAAAALSD